MMPIKSCLKADTAFFCSLPKWKSFDNTVHVGFPYIEALMSTAQK